MCDLPPRALRPRKRAAFTSHIRNAIGTCRRDLVCIRSRNPGAARPLVAGITSSTMRAWSHGLGTSSRPAAMGYNLPPLLQPFPGEPFCASSTVACLAEARTHPGVPNRAAAR
jgi:hypothetical protein